jgi:hypothetical protein
MVNRAGIVSKLVTVLSFSTFQHLPGSSDMM